MTMYALLPSMTTGIAHVDAEHHDLVAAVNRIKSAEEEGSTPKILNLVTTFQEELAAHFKSEEHYLRLFGYPAADAHAQHHAEIVVALDRLKESILSGAAESGHIAEECFAELLGAVFTMDMRFLDWHAELKRRKGA